MSSRLIAPTYTDSPHRAYLTPDGTCIIISAPVLASSSSKAPSLCSGSPLVLYLLSSGKRMMTYTHRYSVTKSLTALKSSVPC